MLSPLSGSFGAQYEALVSSGAIESDAAQEQAAEALADLEQRLANYKPVSKQGLLGRLFADKNEPPPRGLYIHGEVGRGKTMPMDLFFEHSSVVHKRRAHFHEFMAEVHERIHGYRQDIARGEIGNGDVIALTAASIFDDAWTVVREIVRTGHGGGDDVQRCARGSLQGGSEPGAVPAFHRSDIRSHGRAAAEGTYRFPAGEARRREDVAGAGRSCRCRCAEQSVGQDDR